jgi:hypothetical protein
MKQVVSKTIQQHAAGSSDVIPPASLGLQGPLLGHEQDGHYLGRVVVEIWDMSSSAAGFRDGARVAVYPLGQSNAAPSVDLMATAAKALSARTGH